MQNMLSIGEIAPEIKTKGYFPEGGEIEDYKLSRDRGKWVVLTFYPGDFTFVCATDIEAFTLLYGQFKESNASVYAISTDSIYSHKQWSATSPRAKVSKIPLLEDFTKSITESYGFLNKETGAARRGTVIIDPEGKVQYISIHNDALGKDAQHILTALTGLKYIYETPTKEGHICVIPAGWKIGKPALDIDLEHDIGKL